MLPTVGYVARTAARIAAKADALYGADGSGAVDGVHAFTHPFGCSQLGHDLDGTRDILAALADHPNAGGVLIVGLGCESNQIAALMARIQVARRPYIRSVTAQLAVDEVEDGLAQVAELVALARAKRQPVGLDRLVLGVKAAEGSTWSA